MAEGYRISVSAYKHGVTEQEIHHVGLSYRLDDNIAFHASRITPRFAALYKAER